MNFETNNSDKEKERLSENTEKLSENLETVKNLEAKEPKGGWSEYVKGKIEGVKDFLKEEKDMLVIAVVATGVFEALAIGDDGEISGALAALAAFAGMTSGLMFGAAEYISKQDTKNNPNVFSFEKKPNKRNG